MIVASGAQSERFVRVLIRLAYSRQQLECFLKLLLVNLLRRLVVLGDVRYLASSHLNFLSLFHSNMH